MINTNLTHGRVLDLFEIIARYSPATYGPDDVEAWYVVAQIEGWDYAAAGRAVIDHCAALGSDAPWIKPGDVSTRLREVRERIMESYEEPRPEDPTILDSPDYMPWQREQRARHRARGLAHYAQTGELPPPRRPQPLGNRLPEILAGVPEHARPAIEAGFRRIVRRKP